MYESKYVSVCASPLSVAVKMFFLEKGAHVDTVAVSLFLASIWNFLLGGGGWVIGWQCLRKRELPPLETKGPHWLQLLCVTRGATAPLLTWMPRLTWGEPELS